MRETRSGSARPPFRLTWFLATERCDAMIREGRGAELEKLVGEARAFQASLGRNAAY